MALALGDQAPGFDLPGVGGSQVTLDAFADQPVVAIIWSCNHCPTVVQYEDRMVQLQHDYADRGVQVVAINSNDAARYPDDNFARMVERGRQKGFNFPYLRDESQEVAQAYGPTVTPEVFLFNRERRLVYRGRIDDNPHDPSAVKRHDLRQAIEEVLAGKPVSTPQTNPVGCSVKWK